MTKETGDATSSVATLDRAPIPPIGRTKRFSLLKGDDHSLVRWRAKERFHHLFEDVVDGLGARQAKRAVAVEYPDMSCSFADLEAMSNRLARYLDKHGVKTGDRVAVLFDRSIHAYVTLLAVSKVGAAFIPLDVGFPVERVRYILEDSGASCVVTLSFYTQQFNDSELPVLALDAAEEEYARLSGRRLALGRDQLDDDALAYVIYTSGTTGRPKGVPIAHSSIVNFLRVARDAYGYRDDDRVYQALSLAFDYAFEEIWVPLLSGARLVPAPAGVSLLGSDLAAFLTHNQITAFCSVPTVLATIEDDLPDLRLLITSGEACPASLAERWFKHGRRFLNLYGPTETTVSATWSVLEKGRKITIGGPLPTYTVLILDPDEPTVLPHGDVGELAIAGIGVAEGYLNRPEETGRAFIEDFIGLDDNPSGLIYRSGDLARFNHADEIEYIGRKDTQVKIRGFRIELGEIEAAAREVTGIEGIVVNPVEIEEGQKELVAYYVQPSKGKTLDPVALHDGLRDRLPLYMVPSYYEELEAMPLLPSSKVDRQALPMPSTARLTETGQSFVEPKEGMETDLAAVLCTVLNVEKISADADFFTDLGANSLVMARYLGSVRKKLGLKRASMRQIYENSTIAGLAAAIAPKPVAVVQEETAEPRLDEEKLTPLGAEASVAAAIKLVDTPPMLSAPAARAVKITDESEAALVRSAVEPHYVAPQLQYILCGVYQVTYMLFAAFVLALLTDLGFRHIHSATNLLETYLRAVEIGVLSFVGIAALQILVKWIAVGRFKEERIPLWSNRYARLWIAQAAIRTNPLNLFIGTPLYNVFLRLLGAKVGKGTLIFSPPPVCTDLVTIGDNTLIRQDCRMPAYMAHRGYVYTGPISVGDRAYVAEATTLDINASIGDDAQLGTSSALMQGQHVPDGATHQGCPAAETATNFIRVPALDLPPWRARLYVTLQFLYDILIAFPVPIAAVYVLLGLGFSADQLAPEAGMASVGVLSLIGYSALVYFGAIVLALVGVVTLPKICKVLFKSEETHPLFSFQYFLARRLTVTSNSLLLQGLFGDSSLIMPYYKAVGYDLSEATQNGSNFGVQQRHHSPFLCKFNRNTLVSDGLAMLNMDLSSTSFKLSPIEVPPDAYLGNDIHYPTDAKVGKNCLIATKAYVPIDGSVRDDVGLLGSPAFEIPRSVARDGRFDHYKKPGIFEQRLKMKLRSNLITLGLYMIRNWSGLFLTMAAGYALFDMFAAEIAASSLVTAAVITAILMGTISLLPMYYVLFEWASNAYTPMKPRICSLYERPFWDHERFWKLNINAFFAVFNGTPLKSVFVRMQGAKLGRQVFDNGAGITEPYMVEIGDYACLNTGSNIQGHSLEDGTFKSDSIKIGDRCTLGLQGFVHYGAVIGDDAVVETDAFVMKGSVIGDGETWRGNPAQNITGGEADVRIA